MKMAQFSTAITQKGSSYTYPLLNCGEFTNSDPIMQLAPIPPYFVYEGMKQDLDAALVLERALSTSEITAIYYSHLT